MKQKSVIVTSTLAALFALWNGLVIKWYLTKDQKYSTYWHIVGYFIRAIPLYYIYPNIMWILIYSNVAWTLYDIIINKINGWDWFYISKTSATEKLFGKLTLIGKAILLILTLIYIFI